MDWVELINSPFEVVKRRYLSISDDHERMKIKQFLGNLFDISLDDKEKCDFATKILKLNKFESSWCIKDLGEWWKIPQNPDEWLECPKCGNKPKIWIYDNGVHACCECHSFDQYERRFEIKIESVLSCLKRKAIQEYGGEEGLKEEWNKYCRGELTDLFRPNEIRW